MYLLEKLVINKFRGTEKITIPFYEDINFLIGENGSGKTTVIKIILALLHGNIRMLEQLPFESASLCLKDYDDARHATIEISGGKSTKDPDLLTLQINKGRKTIIKITTPTEEMRFAREKILRERMIFPRERWEMERSFAYRKKFREFSDFVQQSIKFDDLSVERLPFRREDSWSEREKDTSLDAILERVFSDISLYFKNLSLASNKEDEVLKEIYVMSLLEPQKAGKYTSNLTPERMEIKLTNILNTFSVTKSKYKPILNNFLQRYREVEKSGSHQEDFVRMEQIVSKYEDIEKKKEEIFYPKDTFLKLVNSLLKNKKIVANDNEDNLYVQQENGNTLSLQKLSSGEKHLLILLGKTLLQRNTPQLFIADEPEISLHIQWQREIVAAIRKLNQNAQILFATHSPEIVAGYDEKIHNLRA